MGLIKQGILGGFRKKTGTVVGAYWRTLDVIRALPRNSGKAPTQLQIEQKQKFALVTSFLSHISDLIDMGFKSVGPLTPMNKAVAYHLKMAVTGTWPDFAIDLPNLMYSTGNLELPYNVTATATAGGKIGFEWDRLTDEGLLINPADAVTIVAYNANRNIFVKAVAATTRGIGEFELQTPDAFEGEEVHLYISFSSTVKKRNSDSLYIGTVILL